MTVLKLAIASAVVAAVASVLPMTAAPTTGVDHAASARAVPPDNPGVEHPPPPPPAPIFLSQHTITTVEADSDIRCATNEVLVARGHTGDENGTTTYRCQRLGIHTDGPYFSWAAAGVRAQPSVQESQGHAVMCPAAAPVMVSRTHSGDENGMTTYGCGAVRWPDGTLVTATSITWHGPQRESDSTGACPYNQAMVARLHDGDEHGSTWWACARLGR